ncbi:unnamed protein product, partial [Ectocarpus fasciculatus]
ASRGEGLGDPNREPEGLHLRSGKREWHKRACLSSNNTWRTKRLACGSGTAPIMCLNNPSSRTSRVAYLFRPFRPSVSSCTWR